MHALLPGVSLCAVGGDCGRRHRVQRPSPALAAGMPTVAVVEFTNKTGHDLPAIDTMATDLLSTLFADSGQVQVVEREKLKNIVEEQGLVMSGLVDQTATAVQVGR